MKSALKWLGISGISAVILGAVLSTVNPSSKSGAREQAAAVVPIEQPAQKPKRENASAILACREFKKVVSGIADGTVTQGELREMLKPVLEDARLAELHDDEIVAPPDGFREQATIMLRALTQDQGPEFMNALGRFNHMCQGL